MLPNGAVTEKVPPIKVLLNGGEQATFTRWDGSFVFRDVAPGRYVVDVPSETFLFSQVGFLAVEELVHSSSNSHASVSAVQGGRR